MAKVEIWIRNDLHRFGPEPRYERIAGWDYSSLEGPAGVAERTFWFLSVGSSLLDGEELALRGKWDSLNRGFGFGVGDIIVVDGQPLRCEAHGFLSVPSPAG